MFLFQSYFAFQAPDVYDAGVKRIKTTAVIALWGAIGSFLLRRGIKCCVRSSRRYNKINTSAMEDKMYVQTIFVHDV